MKRICAFAAILLIVNLLIAVPVTPGQARTAAAHWLAYTTGQVPDDIAVTAWPSETGQHLWIATCTQGFVILPADDATMPILGWGQSFAPNQSIDHPGLNDLLQGYVSELNAIVAAGVSNTPTLEAWNEIARNDFSRWPLTRDVSPLLSTTWNQDWPYNAACPSDAQGPGGHAYAGCGATTMAQIMKFWAHPESGVGQHSYFHQDYGTISADFSAATYNWSQMPNNVTSYNAEVAEILFHCGVSMDMDYGPDGSGAVSPDVVYAFAHYFDYDIGVEVVEREDYSNSTWEQMMRNELENDRPVFYAGYGDYGHAFVMDGYQGTNYFHFNFGWSGYYNGYYYLTSLNPAAMSSTTTRKPSSVSSPARAAPTAFRPQIWRRWW